MSISASVSNTTSVRWPIANFKTERNPSNPIKFSENFPLNSHPTAHFALFLNPMSNFSFNDAFFGIELKQIDNSKPIELNIRFWLENEDGQKFSRYSYEAQVFDKAGDKCGFSVNKEGLDGAFYEEVWDRNKTLFVCCKLLELDTGTFIHNQTFLQAQWTLHEQKIYDAIIQVGDVEFKILKTYFMAQSDAFNRMFFPKFNDGLIGIVEIDDVSEIAMKSLIRWVYTQHIDDESLIEELFDAAAKYEFHLLKTICIERMITSLNYENILIRFALAHLHRSNYLKSVILEHIDRMSKKDIILSLTSPKWSVFIEANGKAASEILKTIHEKAIYK